VLALAQAAFVEGFSFRAFPVMSEWARGERVDLLATWREALLQAGTTAAPTLLLQACAATSAPTR
jgi:hypothetical protein